MARITLNIDADYSAAKSKLEELKGIAQSISGSQINLGIDVGQVRQTAEAMRSVKKSAEDIQKAQEDAMWKAYRKEQELEAKKQSQIANGLKAYQEAQSKKEAAIENATSKEIEAFSKAQEAEENRLRALEAAEAEYWAKQEAAAAAAEARKQDQINQGLAAHQAALAKEEAGIEARTQKEIEQWDRIEAARERAEASNAKKLADLGSGETLGLFSARIDAVISKMSQLRTVTQEMQANLQTVQNAFSVLASPTATLEDKQAAYHTLSTTLQTLNTQIQNVARAEREEDNAARAAEKAERDHARELERQQQAAQGSTGALNALAVALGNIASRAFHKVVAKITQGIREAITEMKEVDTQLTNISKVSGITGKALSDMGERAYETASKYGVAADEYLSAVYTFQKAGLGESAEAMGELAVKTMLVGDTTADVASQFLISANAAWKFGGDIERLNQIVDEADYINNNYATDLGKLSQGLPRVASVAAQAGMSAEETLAAIGTITAVTQESGTKSATALRALILNIEKEVGEFMDDTGETFKVTEESVKSVQGLMEKYAKAELDAAKASGELINPMTAIKAIFEGMANSDLNDQDLFALLSGMGGKLRTNQLTALVQNYEMFDEMLGKIAKSAGTADSEIALMMESWERKTQVLKNTWTEFIADVVDSDEIKASIDGLTQFIDTLDTLLFSSASEQTKDKYKDLHDEMQSLERNSSRLTAQEKERLAYLRDQTAELERQGKIQSEQEAKNWQLKHGRNLVGTNPDGTPLYADQAMYESLTAGWSQAGANFAVGNLNGSDYIAAMKKVVEANRDYYENLIKCKEAGVDLTDWQEKFVTDYEGVQKVAESSSVSLRENADGYWEIVDAQGNVVAWTDKYKTAEERAAEAAQKEADAVAEAAKHQEELNNQNENTREWANYQQEMAQAMAEYDASVADAQTSTSDLAAGADAAADSAADIGTNAKSIDFADAIAQAQALADALAMGSSAAAGIHVNIGGGGGVGGIPSRAKGTSNAEGGATLVNELGPELISENGKAYIANGGKPAIVNLSKGAIVLPANVTKDALNGGVFGGAIKAAGGGLGDREGDSTTPRYTEPTGPAAEAQRQRQRAIEEATSWKCPKCGTVNPAAYKKCYKCGTKKPGTTGGGGGKKTGGGGKSKKEKAAEAAKDLEAKLKSLDKQAALAHKEKRYSDEEALYKEAVALIKKQLSKYKSAGYKDKSDEVVDLKSKLHDYEDKIASLNKNKWDEEIDAREQALREQRARDEMADKQAAVEKARQALENAKKQRNVRVFNAATGQWEWVADQGAVQQAQEQFDSAQRSWTQAQEDAAIDELKRRRDAGEKYPSGSGTGTESLDTISTYRGVGQAVTVGGRSGSKIIDSIGEFGALFGGAPTDTSISTAVKNGVGGDSHDTIYNFGNITLSEAEAQSTSVAELAKRLNVLKIS